MAIAEGGRTGEVRFVGEVENSPAAIERTIKKLGKKYERLHVCFEAGPTVYRLCRQVRDLGHDCMVVAPALIRSSRASGSRRTGGTPVTLARQHRAGELTRVWCRTWSTRLSAIWPGSGPAATLFPSTPWPDLRERRSLDIGAPALACAPELRAYRAADRVPGENRQGHMSASDGEVARPTLRVRGLLGQAEPILITAGRAVADYREAFVGIDVAKLRNALAIADAGREGEVRFFGEVDASDTNIRRVIQRITAKFDRVHFCYEAGPTGYGLYRLVRSLGHECTVVAPSLIPRKPGDRIKTTAGMLFRWPSCCAPAN